MLVFNHVNILDSLQEYGGPEWNIFLFGGTVPATVSEITFDATNFDAILANSIAGLAVTSSKITTPAALNFANNSVAAKLYGYGALGLEKSSPSEGGNPIYKVGIKGISGDVAGLTAQTKLDILSGRSALAFTAAGGANTLEFTLFQTIDLDYLNINAGAGNQYSLEAYASGAWTIIGSYTGPQQRLQVAITGCEKIRLVFTAGSCSISGIEAYSLTLGAPTASIAPTWALLVPVVYSSNLLPAGTPSPYMLLDAGGPATTATVRLFRNNLSPQEFASLAFLRLTPNVMEI